MHTQSNGQSRILCYGVDPVTGKFVPLAINANGSENVSIVQSITLPVTIVPPISQTLSYAYPAGGVTSTYAIYPNTSANVRVNSLNFSSAVGGKTFGKIFCSGIAAPPNVGSPPNLQYEIAANSSQNVALGDAFTVQGGFYIAVETAQGNFAGTGIAGVGSVIMNIIYNIVAP